MSLIRGTLQALGVAWSEHKSGKRDSMGRTRKPPRFKGARFPITTLSDTDCKKTTSIDGDAVKLPVLGEVRIKGNRDGRRWSSGLTVCTYRIQREPSGWYLLLVGDLPAPTVRQTPLAVGLDAGVAHTLTTSEGKHIDGPAALAANLRKLEQLQQQMARQQKGSANWRKSVEKIKRLHERIRRTRKLFAHKTTTYLLRTYDTLAVEDLKLANMVRRPEPKPAEDGQSFLPNQAKAKGGLNRSMLDAGLGQLRVMLETKGKERGRKVVPVDPRKTSQRCSACGHTDPGNRPSQEVFLCLSCGYGANADVNAAFNAAGINLRTANLGALPALTTEQINRLPNSTAQVYFMSPDFKLPRAFQYRIALEQELARAEERWGSDANTANPGPLFQSLRLAAQRLADQLSEVEELEERIERLLAPAAAGAANPSEQGQ